MATRVTSASARSARYPVLPSKPNSVIRINEPSVSIVVEETDPVVGEAPRIETGLPVSTKISYLCHNRNIDPATPLGYVILDFLLSRCYDASANVVAEISQGNYLSLYNRRLDLTQSLAAQDLFHLNLAVDNFVTEADEEIGISRLISFLDAVQEVQSLTYEEKRLYLQARRRLEEIVATQRPDPRLLAQKVVLGANQYSRLPSGGLMTNVSVNDVRRI